MDLIFGHAVQNAMVPGKIEQFSVIVDAKNLKVWETPVKHLVYYQIHGSAFYRHRLYMLKLVNLSWPVRAAIKFFRNFLDEFQTQQFVEFGSDFTDVLL